MSSGKLKASTNRVRTSIALQGNSMWTNTIGMESEAGGNSAIEAAINAPQTGAGRVARKAAAAEAVKQTGGFNSTVDNYESLLTLARSQGAVGGANRGACKRCGQLGHLTKQCRNDQSVFFGQGDQAAPSGVQLEKPPAAPDADGDDLSDLSDLSSSSSSSSSDSSSSEERRRRRARDKKRKHKDEKKRKKHKKHKEDKRKRHKSSKH